MVLNYYFNEILEHQKMHCLESVIEQWFEETEYSFVIL